ncbi:hypothetical protein, partial [Agrobacterium tumefaciens]|uniref:hypothetical protein n=1 Tax=Agrobacterium tumefaciens TaxID=358 RepID=UPI0027E4A80A
MSDRDDLLAKRSIYYIDKDLLLPFNREGNLWLIEEDKCMRRLRPIDFTISARGKATSGPDVSS